MKTSLTCEDVRGCLPLLVGDDLDELAALPVGEPSGEQAREPLREHLAACGECAAKYLAAERARAALLGLVREAPEDLDLWQDLHLHLRSEGILGARPRAAIVRPRTWRPLAAFAGAAAAALMLGIGVWTGSAPETTVAPHVAGSVVRGSTASQNTSPRALTGTPPLLTARSDPRSPTSRTGTAPIPFATLVSHGGGGRLTASDPRSFARHVSDRRVLPTTSALAVAGAASAGNPIDNGAHAELGGLRRATREDELLRNSALPWRQYFHRTPNVPIYWGENATVGFGLR